MDELREAGAEVLFVTTPAPKNGEEKILHGVKGLFAEYERVKIVERFRLGKMRKVNEGHLLVSEAPYGYTYIPKEGKRHGYYEVNETEARIVRQIFSWIADEKITMRAIIRRLQDLEIKPRKSKRGVWSTSTLTTLLRNQTYVGMAHYGASYAVVPENPHKHERYKKIKKTSRRSKPEGEWIKIPAPAILNENLFNRTQEQLKKNFAMSSRNRKNDYLLSGLVRHACGSTMAGEGPNGGRNLYYRCTDRVRSFPLPPKCTEGPVNARIADQLVWEKLEKLLRSPDLLLGEARRWKEGRKDAARDEVGDIKQLEAELEKLKLESDRYTRAYGAGIISMEQLKEYADTVNERMTPLKKQIVAIKGKNNEPREAIIQATEGEIEGFVGRTRTLLQNLNFQQKRAIVVGVVNQVTVTGEDMIVKGRIPVGATSLISTASMPVAGANEAILANNTNVSFSSIHRHRGPSERR